MGKPDQLAKRILREETAAVTNHRVTFEVPREVPVGALQPDGVVRVVAPAPTLLAALSPPWSRLRVEATLDAKMPGDHTDRLALARCELRRHARWVQHLEALRSAEKRGAPSELAPRAQPDPRDFHTWVVAPHVPQWLRDDARLGVCTLDAAAPGCWVVGPSQYETLWIAANDLPLREDLLPLLVARSGRAQHEFLVWSARVRGLDWTLDLIKDLNMDADISAELLDHVPTDDEAQRRIKTAYTRRLLEIYPEAAHEIGKRLRDEGLREGLREGRDEGLLQMLALQFKLRLDRALTPDELDALERRVHTLGAERVGRVVLDMTREALDAWLHDPDAT